MKQLVVDRHTTPGTPTLNPVNTPKVPVYDTLADAAADLANLEENQIVMTPDEGAEELLHPVAVVEKDNTHAVQSGAVASALSYSTEEHFTGRYWIDGKPIYTVCKYLYQNGAVVQGVTYEGSSIMSGDVMPPNIDSIIKSHVVSKRSDGFIDTCVSDDFVPNPTTGKVYFYRSGTPVYAIAVYFYTKTTD